MIVGRREEEGRALEKQIGVRFVRADVANEATSRRWSIERSNGSVVSIAS